MNKVTLYKVHSGFSNTPNGFELESRFADEANGDFSADYELPEGYTVATNFVGRPMIFDSEDSGCEIIEHISGNPQLISKSEAQPVLKRAE